MTLHILACAVVCRRIMIGIVYYSSVIVSGESRRPLGRPPHCGPRRVWRNNVPLRPTAGSNGEQLQSTKRLDSSLNTTHQRGHDSKPASGDGDEAWSSSEVLPSVRNSGSEQSLGVFPMSSSSSPSTKTSSSTMLPPVIDENLVHLLNSYNIRGDASGSRPSSAGSSNSGRKRGSPRSQSVARVSSTLPRRSPRTAMSLDNVDLWDDNSDLSASSSSTSTAATSSIVRRTVDLGRSSPAHVVSAPSENNRFRLGSAGRRPFGTTSFAPSRKLIRRHRREDDKDDEDRHGNRLLQQQWQQRHFRHEKTSPPSSSAANGKHVVRRTLNDATTMMDKIPQLVESTGRPMTACRPTTDANSSAAPVRLNFHNGTDLQLYIRGLRMFAAESTKSVMGVDEENGATKAASVGSNVGWSGVFSQSSQQQQKQ